MAWVADPDSDVVYAEKVEGRLAVRMRQQVREATTVWFWVGDRSLIAEAYVIPAPAERRGGLPTGSGSKRSKLPGELRPRSRRSPRSAGADSRSNGSPPPNSATCSPRSTKRSKSRFAALVGLVRQREKMP